MNDKTIVKIKTWYCPSCGYTAPSHVDSYGAKFLAKYPGVVAGGCPSCATHPIERNHSPLELLEGVDLDAMVRIESSGDAALEAMMVEDLDSNGEPIMIQTGERYELRVNPQTGEIYSEPVPVYEPKMRSLTPQELTELKTERDQNLDALESVAVKEVSDRYQS